MRKTIIVLLILSIILVSGCNDLNEGNNTNDIITPLPSNPDAEANPEIGNTLAKTLAYSNIVEFTDIESVELTFLPKDSFQILLDNNSVLFQETCGHEIEVGNYHIYVHNHFLILIDDDTLEIKCDYTNPEFLNQISESTKIETINPPIIQQNDDIDLTNYYNLYCNGMEEETKYWGCQIDVIQFLGNIKSCENDLKDKGWIRLCKEDWVSHSGNINNCYLLPDKYQQNCLNRYNGGSIYKKNFEEIPIFNFTKGTKGFSYFLPYRYERLNYSSSLTFAYEGYYYGRPSLYITIDSDSRLIKDINQFAIIFSPNKKLSHILDFDYIDGRNDKLSKTHILDKDVSSEWYGQTIYLVNYILPLGDSIPSQDSLDYYINQDNAFVFPIFLSENLKEK